MEMTDFQKFENSLFEKLLVAFETKEIDNVVDVFLREVSINYNFEVASIFFLTGDLLILRGVFGLDRYFVCKVAYETNEYVENWFDSKNKYYIGDNIKVDNLEIFNDFETMMVLPIYTIAKPIGIMTIRSKEDKKWYFQEIAEELSILVRHFAIYANSILHETLKQEKEEHIMLLNDVLVNFSLGKDLINSLDNIAQNLTMVFSAKKSFLILFDDNGEPYLRSAWGVADDVIINLALFKKNENIDNLACVNNIGNIEELKEYRSCVEHSIMVLPLKADEITIGILAIIDKIPSATNPLGDFLLNDRHLFENTAAHIAVNIHSYNTLKLLDDAIKRNKNNTSRLNILYELTNSLIGKLKIDDILFILLTAATLGEAFGYNRAFIFLYDQDENIFKGSMCVAPVDGNDAASVWHELEIDTTISVREKLLLFYSEKDLKNMNTLTKKIRKFGIPADDNCLIFKQVYKTKKPMLINDIYNNELVYQINSYTDMFGDSPFAVVPMIGENSCIGMIVVDNKFTSHTIDSDDINYIKMFAQQTAIAIEYSNLYQSIEESILKLRNTEDKLIEASHLALIGEMSASISHNLRNLKSMCLVRSSSSALLFCPFLRRQRRKYYILLSPLLPRREETLHTAPFHLFLQCHQLYRRARSAVANSANFLARLPSRLKFGGS